MSLHRWAARRDSTERAIVEALRAIGCEVWQVSGRGLPDLLVRRYAGTPQERLWAAEVKTKKGKMTRNQGKFPVWRSVDEAIREVTR